jgi:hypothetical protein
MNNRTTLLALGLVSALALAALLRPAFASIFGEENLTLVKQLAELMRIHDELTLISQAAERGADVAHDLYTLQAQARAGVDELAGYTTDKFLRDLERDVYRTYPGFEVLVEGAGSSRVKRWKDSRAKSPFTTYEMISAVFGDLTEPLKERARQGDLTMDRAAIWRYEAAGALALANEAEAWTAAADEDARELYRLAADADAAQAQHLSARALALIAVQNSHVIRLLSRNVRFDGITGAMAWAGRVDSVNERDRLHEGLGKTLSSVQTPPRMMTFPKPF